MLKLSLYTFLLWPNQCHVFATTLTKVLVERKQMENQHLVCNGLPLCLSLKEKSFETDVNVSQTTTLLLLHFPYACLE